jgi:integral membrane protein (TIGR01906 family)
MAVWLVGLSFMVVLLPPVTHFLADSTVTDEPGDVSHEALVALAGDGLAYVTFGGGEPLPVGDDERLAFTPEIISHLDDVRLVLRTVLVLTTVLTLVLVAMFLILRRRGMGSREAAPVLIAAGVAPLTCVFVLGLVGVVSFDTLFTAVHQLLFADGTWTFSYDSLLIRTYPLAFWMGMGIVWAVTIIFVSVLALTIGLNLRARRCIPKDAP